MKEEKTEGRQRNKIRCKRGQRRALGDEGKGKEEDGRGRAVGLAGGERK